MSFPLTGSKSGCYFFLIICCTYAKAKAFTEVQCIEWTCLSRCWTQVSSTSDVVFDETGKFDPHLPYVKDELLEATDERRNAYGITEREATNQWPLRWYLG